MVRKNQTDSSDDEDDTFYYRYPSSSSSNPASTTTSKPQQNPNTNDNRAAKTKGGSKGLAPSKSTLYVSNLDYTLTNSDLHTLFSTFGKIARVTVLKDRVTRQSRGVAFVQFVSQDHAFSAARQMHGKILNGRTISASIAADNGRAPEFIRKRVYKDKSRCYECGDDGHLSYECPKNQLGPRERPVPKKPRGGGGGSGGGGFRIGDRGYDDEEEEEEEEEVGLEDDNWASVVDGGANQRLLTDGVVEVEEKKRKKVKKASYFSDESEEDE